MELYCRRDNNPETELSHINIAPQAAASFSVPKPKTIISGTR